MSVAEEVAAKNAKVDADNKKGKADVASGKSINDRVENIERFLGWRDE